MTIVFREDSCFTAREQKFIVKTFDCVNPYDGTALNSAKQKIVSSGIKIGSIITSGEKMVISDKVSPYNTNM